MASLILSFVFDLLVIAELLLYVECSVSSVSSREILVNCELFALLVLKTRETASGPTVISPIASWDVHLRRFSIAVGCKMRVLKDYSRVFEKITNIKSHSGPKVSYL